MRMPPLLADLIHARGCKLKCEKFLTLPSYFKTKNRRPEKYLAAIFCAYYSTRNRRVITISCVVSSPFISSTLS